MKILSVPLDIRPYNYDFLLSLGAMDSRVSLQLPPKEALGVKKLAANLVALSQFVIEQAGFADALVISLDMYVYGGLFPARVHHVASDVLLARLEELAALKVSFPQLKIYASSLVLRTPKYDSSEEEPMYYAHSGAAIFSYGYLTNKQQRVGLDATELAQLDQCRQKIAPADLTDWLERRAKNLQVTEAAIALVAKGVIERLVIPLDDTAEYGFTAMDQEQIYRLLAQYRVQDRVHVHPGTDESGCTLLTRAYLDQLQVPFEVAVSYSSEHFQNCVPNYEDRPFANSLQSHAAACGIALVSASDTLPLLAINGCGDTMQEAFAVSYGYCVHSGQKKMPYKNVSYYTRRDLVGFVKNVAARASRVPTVVADVAFSNGGETELIELLDEHGALDKIVGYAGWNTTCNTLGTALAILVFASLGDNLHTVRHFLQERLISDWAYQSETRFPIQYDYLPTLGAGYGDFDAVAEQVFAQIACSLHNVWQRHIRHSFYGQVPAIKKISAPFKRLSGLHIELEHADATVPRSVRGQRYGAI